MSGDDESKTEMKELMDRFNKYAKQVKLVLTKLEEIDKKIDNVVSAKTVSSEEEKEKLDKIFEAKQVGRPRGTFSDKQKQYLKMLEGKVKMPKSQTLEYYRIVKDGDEYKLID
jgi:hypothetical protein